MTCIYAHRGWSTGCGDDWTENSIEAFIKSSATKNIDGVEIDIRFDKDSEDIVLSHDPIEPTKRYTTLDTALNYITQQNWQILIEFKEYSPEMFLDVVNLLKKYNLVNSALLFGFSSVVREFPWQQNHGVKLGIIVEYPWKISDMINKYNPQVLLTGWDDRYWTSIAFRLFWSIFSLKRASQKNNVDIICGVASTKDEANWLSKQGITGYTADMPLL
jgi:hypothetical protein